MIALLTLDRLRRGKKGRKGEKMRKENIKKIVGKKDRLRLKEKG